MTTGRTRGFSLPELLVVLAILGLSIAVVVPLVASSVRQAKIRGAADQFATDLKAARMIAVTQRSPVEVTVSADPVNAYEYADTAGRMTPRRVALPEGSLVVNSSQGGGSKDTWVIDDAEADDRFASVGDSTVDTPWPAVPWPTTPAPKRSNSPSAHDDRLVQQERQQQQSLPKSLCVLVQRAMRPSRPSQTIAMKMAMPARSKLPSVSATIA